MARLRRYGVDCAVRAVVLMFAAAATAAEKERQFEDFDSAKFSRSTQISNKWFPLKPGVRYIWEGTSLDEDGDEEPHSVVLTVTDLTKSISGVRTVVCLEQDFADGELVEAEIVFFAQDDDGNVWHLGQYPEEYDEGEIVATPAWIHGVGDGRAGIMITANPRLGDPSFSQGLSLSLPWTDRAQVLKTGEKTTVPYGTFEDVLVMQEWDQEEPNARQLKYYAAGVGNVRVGWAGDDSSQESLELISVDQLTEAELRRARDKAIRLENNAYIISKEVYGRTRPIEGRKPKPSGNARPL